MSGSASFLFSQQLLGEIAVTLSISSRQSNLMTPSVTDKTKIQAHISCKLCHFMLQAQTSKVLNLSIVIFLSCLTPIYADLCALQLCLRPNP